MLQPIDIATAVCGAWIQAQDRDLRHTDLLRHLDLPASSITLSLSRLRHADVIRRDRVQRVALAQLLPVLRWLVPIKRSDKPDRIGIVTGYASPGFHGWIRARHPWVWELAGGESVGWGINPMHERLPAALAGQPDLHQVFAYVDAMRGGRARETHIAMTALRTALALPPPRQPSAPVDPRATAEPA